MILHRIAILCVWIAMTAGGLTGQQPPAFFREAVWNDVVTPFPVAIDVNNDGISEFAWGVSQQGIGGQGPGLTYRMLMGSRTWAQGPTFWTPGLSNNLVGCTAMVSADFNGDGNADVFADRHAAVPPFSPMPGIIWFGDGRGNFVAGSTGFPSRGTFLKDAIAFDADGDGDLDLFLCDITGPLLYINDGHGNFTDETSTRLVGLGFHPWCCLAVDVNQDGYLDVFVGNGLSVNEPASVFVNNGNGFFTEVAQAPQPSAWLAAVALDVDMDGHDDVLAFPLGSPPVIFLTRQGQTQMSTAPNLAPPWTSFFVHYAAAFDIDQDGFKDVIMDQGNALRLWMNLGGGAGFVDHSAGLPGYSIGDGPGRPFVMDLDFDGDVDVIMGSRMLFNTLREVTAATAPTRGGVFAVDFLAQQNHLMLTAISQTPVRLQVPGLGWLWMDPTASVLLQPLFFATRSAQRLTVPVPNQPWVTGMIVGMQGLDVDLTRVTGQTTGSVWEIVQ
jgi:hypothetical protein